MIYDSSVYDVDHDKVKVVCVLCFVTDIHLSTLYSCLSYCTNSGCAHKLSFEVKTAAAFEPEPSKYIISYPSVCASNLNAQIMSRN